MAAPATPPVAATNQHARIPWTYRRIMAPHPRLCVTRGAVVKANRRVRGGCSPEPRGIARERFAMQCPHRPPCPGCPRFAVPGIASTAGDALGALARSCGLPPPKTVEGPALGYRHRARLAVRGRATSPKIGIFQEDTHRIA